MQDYTYLFESTTLNELFGLGNKQPSTGNNPIVKLSYQPEEIVITNASNADAKAITQVIDAKTIAELYEDLPEGIKHNVPNYKKRINPKNLFINQVEYHSNQKSFLLNIGEKSTKDTFVYVYSLKKKQWYGPMMK